MLWQNSGEQSMKLRDTLDLEEGRGLREKGERSWQVEREGELEM